MVALVVHSDTDALGCLLSDERNAGTIGHGR